MRWFRFIEFLDKITFCKIRPLCDYYDRMIQGEFTVEDE